MAEVVGALILLAAVFAAFAVDVLVFAMVRRLAPAARRGRAHLAGAITAAAAFSIVFWLVAPAPATLLLPGLVMVACDAYVLFHLDNMAETARRVRILREIDEAGEGLTRDRILLAYPPREVFERRIDRLVLAGQVGEEGGRLRSQGGSYALMEKLLALCARVVFGPPDRARM